MLIVNVFEDNRKKMQKKCLFLSLFERFGEGFCGSDLKRILAVYSLSLRTFLLWV